MVTEALKTSTFSLDTRIGKCLRDAMRIIAAKTIVAFGDKHPLARAALKYWLTITLTAQWKTTSEITGSFRNAKVLNAERVRFEIAGGAFRMVVAFHFPSQACWIKFIGTHEEYDRIDALTVDLY